MSDLERLIPKVLSTPTLWVIRNYRVRHALERLLHGSPALVVCFGAPLMGHRFDEIYCDAPASKEEIEWWRDEVQIKLSAEGRMFFL